MLEKILQEIDDEINAMCHEKQEYFNHGNFHNGNIVVEQIIAAKRIRKIVRAHVNDGWIKLPPDLIADCHCGDCAHVEWRSNIGRVYCPKTHSWRDADDFCKFAEKGAE